MDVESTEGPAVYARAALGAEPVLWAAFSTVFQYDVPGLYPNGEPLPSMLVRMLPGSDAKISNAVGGSVAVCVFGKDRDRAAVRYAKALPERTKGVVGTFLWALTPRRLHIARRVDVKAGGGGVAEVVGSLLSWGAPRPVERRELVPAVDIPAEEIAGFAVAEREGKPCLRMELRDGSGMDLLFGEGARSGYDTEADQYHRLLALSRGRTDPWC